MKLVGIVGRAYYNLDKQEIFQVHEPTRRFLTSYDDVTFVSILPFGDFNYVDYIDGVDEIKEEDKKKLDYILDMCDGFVIPGGTYTYNFDEYVMKYAIDNDKPLMCICAGFQALCNMYSKDRNKFDMSKEFDNKEIHHVSKYEYVHDVNITKDTLLYDILKEARIKVNSIHKNYIDHELTDLIPCAYSDDGILEAVYLPNKKCVLGLEWHPEGIFDEYTKKITDYFVSKL